MTLKNYILAFGIVVLVLVGTIFLFFRDNTSGGVDTWNVTVPADGFVAKDEFIPVSFSYTAPSSIYGKFVDGNFSIALSGGKDNKVHILPLYPREIPNLFESDGINVVRFGDVFAINKEHTFSGYAYLSPLIFDGKYDARFVFDRTEEGKSPTVLSQSKSRKFEVKRIFQTRHSLAVSPLSASAMPHGDGMVTLLRFSISAPSDAVEFRALEMGAKSVRRIPDAVVSLALYDEETGKLLSTLTDAKLSAQTLERYTVYVLDTPFAVDPKKPIVLELRARVDAAKLGNGRIISFNIPRLYGINSEEQKIAEQVTLSVSFKIPE